jgi:NAD(P)-dependent dehydrogenase (short-subunit alcohol dehydrogenase family)
MATFKVIIVTGASRGIGLAVANYLFALKCHKLVLVARSPQPLQAFQNQDPASIETVSADMAELGVGKEVIAQALRRFGRLDGLVVNHGMLDPVQKVSDSKVEDWRNAFEVNFFSAIDLVWQSTSDP